MAEVYTCTHYSASELPWRSAGLLCALEITFTIYGWAEDVIPQVRC